MPEIKLTNVTKHWGRFYGVDHLNLDIENNAFITILGPSGCGKTTTLRMIAGLETPTSGQIKIGDQIVYDSDHGINVPPNKRKVGFLFQNYALWPNMTVYENISFGLKNVKEEKPVIDFDAKIANDMIRALKSELGLTVIMVTHDPETLAGLATHIAVLAGGRIETFGSQADVMAAEHPVVEAFRQGGKG